MSVNKVVAFINKLPLPNRAWIITILAAAWWVVDFNIEYKRLTVYYTKILASGSLPPDADSISIPILSYAFGDIMLGLFFSAYLLWALSGIKPNNKAIKFNKQKPIRSTFSWVITGLWLSIALVMLVGRFQEGKLILISLQFISIYCAIATNATVQNKD